MAKIIAPNKNYNGVSATVKFTDGEGRTNDSRLLVWFKTKGYEVIDEKSVDAEPAEEKEQDSKPADEKEELENMTVDQLKELAKENNIKVASKAVKADLIETISKKIK